MEREESKITRREITRRDFLKGVFSLGGAFFLTGCFPFSQETVDSGENKEEDQVLDLYEHVFQDLKATGAEGFFLTEVADYQSVSSSIIDHVSARARNATNEEYRLGHCPQTAENFLRKIMDSLSPEAVEKFLNESSFFIQRELTRGGLETGYEIVKIVYSVSGLTSTGFNYENIIAYITLNPNPPKGFGTVFAVLKKGNVLRSSGIPIQDFNQKMSYFEQIRRQLKNLCSSEPTPTPRGKDSSRVPVQVPVPEKGKQKSNDRKNTLFEVNPNSKLVLGGVAATVVLAMMAALRRGKNTGFQKVTEIT